MSASLSMLCGSEYKGLSVGLCKPWSGVGKADGGDEAVRDGGRPINGAAPAGRASCV